MRNRRKILKKLRKTLSFLKEVWYNSSVKFAVSLYERKGLKNGLKPRARVFRKASYFKLEKFKRKEQ
jgi:hypothetical protein